jgi:UPF0755 protein
MYEPLQYITETPPQENPIAPTLPPEAPSSKKKVLVLAASILCVVALLVLLFILIRPPRDFPFDTVVRVADGETLSGIASKLAEAGALRSEFIFKAFVTLFAGSKGLQAGEYYLEGPQSSLRLAWRFSKGSYDLKLVRVTIPEGTNSMEIAKIFAENRKFTNFDEEEFAKSAAKYEGYLFPDTYLFLPNVEEKDVIDAMLENYQKKIAELSADIAGFGRSITDVIKMASIIEEEARTEETRRTIAGILWKRFDEGMPLQVDAAFAFVNGKKDSKYITLEDLQIDSPYNTYVRKGLPPTPISNPGLAAIKATVTPIPTKYYFYLSDIEGNMHYAVTHDGHLANKAKYIPW